MALTIFQSLAFSWRLLGSQPIFMGTSAQMPRIKSPLADVINRENAKCEFAGFYTAPKYWVLQLAFEGLP